MACPPYIPSVAKPNHIQRGGRNIKYLEFCPPAGAEWAMPATRDGRLSWLVQGGYVE